MADELLKTSQETKSKRGRPSSIHPYYEEYIQETNLRNKSRRTQLNGYYQQEAARVLDMGKDVRFKWLMDREKDKAGKTRAVRGTILAELGKIGDAETIRGVALQLCKIQPTTKDALVMIRRWRGTLKGKPSVKQLSNVISGTVIDYADSHGFNETWKILDEAWQMAFMQLTAMWAMRQPPKTAGADE